MYSYLIEYNLLSDQQFGFREKFSTSLAFSKLYDDLLNNMYHGLYTCSIFLDLSKAFDTINHAILLEKRDKLFDIRGKGLDIFQSYLFNR